MRKIDYIVLHCTATPTNVKVESIKRYWKDDLKWNNPGYHYLIDFLGTVHQLADHSVICNGVAGYNRQSIHISTIGGIDLNGKPFDNRSESQKISTLNRTRMELKYDGERYASMFFFDP
jgi:N-acetylmuramoyl-L-alanine amidase